MTCVIVNDASCLIDLQKGKLLGVLGSLPYRLVVRLPVRESEMLNKTLDLAGVRTYDLTPGEVREAFSVMAQHPALSANDCFCFVTARSRRGILLTGDSLLRRVATRSGLRVHGVLWVIDRLHEVEACSTSLLVRALETWRSDGAVYLPRDEVANRLRYLADGSLPRGDGSEATVSRVKLLSKTLPA